MYSTMRSVAAAPFYKDGWKAEVYHQTGTSFANDKWQLYNLNEDFNEQKDLATNQPDKLKELQALFETEAQKYNLYPLLGDTTARSFQKLTKGPFDVRRQAILYPGICATAYPFCTGIVSAFI